MRLATSTGGFLALILGIWLLAGFGPATADDLFGEPQTIPLDPSGVGGAAAPAVRVLQQDDESLLLEFTLPGIQSQSVTIAGETYHLLSIEGGAIQGADGQPSLPSFARMVRIPDLAGVDYEITALETTELSGYRPFPAQPDRVAEFVIDRDAYARPGYPESERVTIGEPALARGVRIVPLIFSPVRCDAARGTLEVARRIEVRLRFAGTDLRNARLGPSRGEDSPATAEILGQLVVNYDGPRAEPGSLLGHYLIICPDDAAVISALQPLIAWRQRKGYAVTLATTTQTGTSREAIKAYLQNAYDTWSWPPDFVCLVGDADGAIAIPCWTYSGGETDHPYTQLDGTDVVSDVFIGRISVDTVDRLRLYVTKIVGYESTPYMADTSWYTRACLVGDPTSSGATCIQVMQWVKTHLLENGYTQVDTVFAGPWVTQMTNAINRGDTVFSYRGYYGTSGFNNGHIEALANGWKMPFAPMITCGTGSFSGGTSRSESWMRAGLPPSTPTGGIASVGTATTGTVTRYNNCITYGFWRGVFIEDIHEFGAIFTRGKYELFLNYYPADTGGGGNHIHWNNLMGDPAGEIWTGVPQTLTVSHPASIPLGANSVIVRVDAQGAPCADAYVCLWQAGGTHVGGYTGADGMVELAVLTPAAGTMRVTVTKHDHRPYLADVPVAASQFVGYLGHAIDDDLSGTSSGNGDGQVNPTERIELPVRIQNYGTAPVTSVIGTLICDDAYVTIADGSETFGNIPAGGTAWSADDFDIVVAGAAPAGHIIRLGLNVTSGTSSWHSLIDIPIAAADLVFDDLTLYDVGAQLDPGESGTLSVSIRNQGSAAAAAVTGTLVSQSGWVTVTDSTGTFGNIAIDATGENTVDRFAVSAAEECFAGHIALMALELEFSGGARDTLQFAVGVGTAAADDPTGPDAHGYYAFDNTDVQYVHAPAYSWVEIDPHHGGQGTSVGLTDYGFEQDDSRVVTLPFPFIFYGQAFTRATICSNGWIAMGSTYLSDCWNYIIPGAAGPANLIAPMWDDLYQTGDDQVYHWFDSVTHRYIVQWSRLRNEAGDREENFEVILYDPAHYPTDTGDGEIVFQYDVFNNSDPAQHYCTVGIENQDHSTGVLYTYFNIYNTGAATIQSGRAIKFATYSDFPTGVLMGSITNQTNGGTPLPDASVRLLESGRILVSGPDGIYGGGVRTGTYTAVASHPSFAPDTAHNVVVLEGETVVVDFALRDVLPPQISNTTQLPITGDESGPYAVSANVVEYSALTELSLNYNVNGSGWVQVPLTPAGGDLYRADIPGQPSIALIKYHLTAADAGGNASRDPVDAPWENYAFWVLDELFEEHMESGAGGWFSYALGDTFYDQWHLSVQRNHTPGGTTAWKFGDQGSGDYTDLAHGALETAPITLAEDATLTFWHWIEAETSGAHQGYCYDGGLVEMSVDGGDWTPITPVGGYPYRIRNGSILGPFPAETPVFSGAFGWTPARFELAGITGELRFRFRFGSDGADTREGWYIDDLEIIPVGPGSADVVAPADGEHESLPALLALHPCTPNPFRGASGATLMRFDLPQAQKVRLQVFDLSGRLLRTLVDGALAAGRYGIAWDGRDDGRHPVASGAYFTILRAEGQQQARRVILTR